MKEWKKKKRLNDSFYAWNVYSITLYSLYSHIKIVLLATYWFQMYSYKDGRCYEACCSRGLLLIYSHLTTIIIYLLCSFDPVWFHILWSYNVFTFPTDCHLQSFVNFVNFLCSTFNQTMSMIVTANGYCQFHIQSCNHYIKNLSIP